MANSVPMWWMRGNSSVRAPEAVRAEIPPPPLSPPRAEQEPPPQIPVLSELTARLRHPDGETMLLLALLYLLWQEHADRKLLLALAYIVL